MGMTEAGHAQTGFTWEENQVGHVGWAALLDGCLCHWAQGSAAGLVACPRNAAVHHALAAVDHNHTSAAGARLQSYPHPAPGSMMLQNSSGLLVVLPPLVSAPGN